MANQEMSPNRALLELSLPLIDRAACFAARRLCFDENDTEELLALARLRLIENDFSVLRRWSGKSCLSTYLTAVVQNLARDLRIGRWGRWRPSATAQSLGTAAVALEKLIQRDGFAPAEAVEIVHRRGGGHSLVALAALTERLPVRASRRMVGEEALAFLPSPLQADHGLRAGERRRAAQRTATALAAAFQALAETDRLILTLRFRDGQTVAAIARATGREQRPLYRRIERILKRLREALEEAGVERPTALQVVGASETEFTITSWAQAEAASRAPKRVVQKLSQEECP